MAKVFIKQLAQGQLGDEPQARDEIRARAPMQGRGRRRRVDNDSADGCCEPSCRTFERVWRKPLPLESRSVYLSDPISREHVKPGGSCSSQEIVKGLPDTTTIVTTMPHEEVAAIRACSDGRHLSSRQIQKRPELNCWFHTIGGAGSNLRPRDGTVRRVLVMPP